MNFTTVYTAYALLHIHEQNIIFKYTTMGPFILKEMKYNLYYGGVRGNVLLTLLVACSFCVCLLYLYFIPVDVGT